MSGRAWDVVVIGAGSVGVPLAMSLAERKIRVLCIDEHASAGQGNNKCAIGGIRATHSEPAKVALCLHSLETFRAWKERHGEEIGWREGGYAYVAYDETIAALLRGMIPKQQAAGLNIRWIEAEEMRRLIPGINGEGLLGGTHSPEDGSAHPVRSGYAFHRRAVRLGAVFRFREKVSGLRIEGGRVKAVTTNRGSYACGAVVNCAGSFAKEVGAMAGVRLPVTPDCHESGITEPVKRFFDPMVVDIRKAPGSANYYFYQHDTGQIVFCMTPDPPILGTSVDETSEFLPLVAPRMVDLLPRLANLKVRRVWRGNYPQTPDGSPIVGRLGPENHWAAVGMCGQGFMLGPGVGDLVARALAGESNESDGEVLHALRPDRPFSSEEALK
ncbi:MAG: FAD-binding oxidoreductase [Candidatus Eisenbacteria bacterium]|nr:FAD-binding oxidoreductase [Candidatus Eisenbacteria bacterium]